MANENLLKNTIDSSRFPTKHHDFYTTPQRHEQTIASADLLANLTTGITINIDSKSGYFLEIIRCTAYLKYGTTTYTLANNINIQGVTSNAVYRYISTTLIQETASKWSVTSENKNDTGVTAEQLELYSSSNATTGDSDLYLFIEYRYVKEP